MAIKVAIPAIAGHPILTAMKMDDPTINMGKLTIDKMPYILAGFTPSSFPSKLVIFPNSADFSTKDVSFVILA